MEEKKAIVWIRGLSEPLRSRALAAVKRAPLMPEQKTTRERCISTAINWVGTVEGRDFWLKASTGLTLYPDKNPVPKQR